MPTTPQDLTQILSPLLSSPTYQTASISCILAERICPSTGIREYLVDWTGFGPEFRSWQPISAFEDDVSVLEKWFVEQREEVRRFVREEIERHEREVETLQREVAEFKKKNGRRDSMSP